MNCPACGALLNDQDRFCSHCGAPRAAATATAAVPPATAATPTPTPDGTMGGSPYSIVGYETQAVSVQLDTGRAVLAEPGALLYMRGQVAMSTAMRGGMMQGLQRALAGDSFFLAEFSGPGEACFAAPYPGTIHALPIGPRQWLCQRHSFLCCSPEVAISVAFSRRLGYGLFSGEGFILQNLSGQGDALVHAGGHFIRMELAAGERIRIDTGSVVAFEAGIAYDIEFVKGVRNMLFGGEGLFFIVLTGPGTIILQTLSFDRLAGRIAAAAAARHQTGGAAGTAIGLGTLGAALGGVLGGSGNDPSGGW
jgi:uncharacterized protein (TIGR00266 family)